MNFVEYEVGDGGFGQIYRPFPWELIGLAFSHPDVLSILQPYKFPLHPILIVQRPKYPSLYLYLTYFLISSPSPLRPTSIAPMLIPLPNFPKLCRSHDMYIVGSQ